MSILDLFWLVEWLHFTMFELVTSKTNHNDSFPPFPYPNARPVSVVPLLGNRPLVSVVPLPVRLGKIQLNEVLVEIKVRKNLWIVVWIVADAILVSFVVRRHPTNESESGRSLKLRKAQCLELVRIGQTLGSVPQNFFDYFPFRHKITRRAGVVIVTSPNLQLLAQSRILIIRALLCQAIVLRGGRIRSAGGRCGVRTGFALCALARLEILMVR